MQLGADQIHFRGPHVSDVPFVLSTWLRSNAPDPRIPSRLYYKEHERRLKALLGQPETTVVLACSAKNEDVLFGWMCSSKLSDCSILHYIFVKRAYRKLGIARELLSRIPTPDFHTHQTPMLQHLKLGSVYNPYLA